MPPTVVLRQRTVNTTEWTEQDIDLLLALEQYESTLCPGCNHPLAETSNPDHRDAYLPGEHVICQFCRMQALVSETVGKQYSGNTAGVMVPLQLDPEVVELNRQPKPPLPPELTGHLDADQDHHHEYAEHDGGNQ